jgi:hypothetical protein
MTTIGKRKGLLRFFQYSQVLVFIMVPEDGIEPSLSQGKGDFESPKWPFPVISFNTT